MFTRVAHSGGCAQRGRVEDAESARYTEMQIDRYHGSYAETFRACAVCGRFAFAWVFLVIIV
jgi:hypothetical protein